MPWLNALRRRHPDLTVIGVNVDALVTDAWRFLDTLTIDYPMAFDPGGEAAGRYGVTRLPAGYLIDQQRVVRSVTRSADPAAMRHLEQRIEKLLAAAIEPVENVP